MTFILDPGNAANSYSDGLSRDWKTTAGLWKGDAKDTSGSTHPTGWASGQLWSATASQWQTQYNSEVTLYNNEVTSYNTLLNGLTDTVTTTSLTTLTWNASGGSGSSSTFTVTIPKTGHYEISIFAVFAVVKNAFGSNFTCTTGGTAGVSNSINMTQGNNSGTDTVGYGYHAHGTYTSGQTITFQVSSGAWNTGSVSAGEIAAHWVPTTANPS